MSVQETGDRRRPNGLATETAPEPVNYYALEYHPEAQRFPLIEGAEFTNLIEDIKAKGLLVPITLCRDKSGKVWILDGRNRHRACLQAGYKFRDADFKWYSGQDPRGYSISANVERRQLDNKAKRKFIAEMIEACPDIGHDDKAVAKLCRVDPKTVGSVRADMAARLDKAVELFGLLNTTQQKEFMRRVTA
jgi:hypothetical protein